MSTRFLSTSPTPPTGFESCELKKSDLLRGTVILHAEYGGEELLSGLWNRFSGVLLVPGETFVWERKGPNAWMLHLPPQQLPIARGLLEPWSQSLTHGREAHGLKVTWEKEIARLNREHAAMREHYHLITEQLRDHVQQVSELNQNLQEQLQRACAAEEALGRSERDLAITLDSIGDAVVATDENLRIRRMNPAGEALSGLSRTEAIGCQLLDVFLLMKAPGQGAFQEPQAFITYISAPAAPHPQLFLQRGLTGIRLAPSVSSIQETSGATLGYVFVFRDITRSHQMEEELRQRQRLDALGQLAGGVAHEFNNLLAGIDGFAELLEPSVRRDLEALRYLKSIHSTVERASGLTRQLLSFARKQISQMEVLDLHPLIREVLDLASHTFDRRIEIEISLDATSSIITGEPSLLQTALLNLFINARDAMPQGGRLRVKTSNLPQAQAQGIFHAQEDLLVLVVEDTGTGIRDEHLPHIFEPFFTTKSPGKGTGLGLSALYGVLQEHRGHVCVSSQEGLGSIFTLYFPLSAQQPRRSLASQEETPHPGHILVVDDEAFIRQFLKTGLERHGYEVSLRENGLEGVRAIVDQPDTYDLVIMDLNMPGMNGRDALAALRPAAPTLPVILASGYITEEDLEELKSLGAAAVLPKPFRLQDLLKKVGEHVRTSQKPA